MTSEEIAHRPRRRAMPIPVIAWLTVLAVVVGSVVAVWATGGFGTDAKPFLGSRVQVGDVVKTRFWDVVVHEAEVSESRGEIRVAVTATNKQRGTTLDLTHSMLVIRLPDGTPMLRSSCSSLRGYRFAPLIPADADCVFSFEGNDLVASEIPAPGPFEIEFIVLDQEMSNNLITAPEPQAGEPAAWLPMTVRVAVEEDA
ncbi:hypothetical protein [Tessaracoccus sp.]